MGQKIDVKAIVESNKEVLSRKIKKLSENNITPKLAVILANDDDASKLYVSKKKKLCDELGILQKEYILDKIVTTEDILNIINELNNDESVDGILVQLPLFKHLNEERIIDAISPAKDVDGFHPLNLGKLFIGKETITSCTPKGIMTILDNLGVDLVGKNAVVVGRSVIVGKPMAHLLLKRGATVTICHSKTKDLSSHTKNADVLVVATGVPGLITKDMVKPNSIIIDVGINKVDGKVVGDVKTDEVQEVVEYITPVPGGVGITTVLSLVENLVDIASKKLENN